MVDMKKSFNFNHLKEFFYGNVDFDDMESGGPQCKEYMTIQFKIIVNILSLLVYYFLIKKIKKNIVYEDKMFTKSPSLIETITGYLALYF